VREKEGIEAQAVLYGKNPLQNPPSSLGKVVSKVWGWGRA
jgi:hypothetical protein